MENTYKELIELAWSEGDSNAIVFNSLGKLFRFCWARGSNEKIRAEITNIEPLMNEKLPTFDICNFGLSLAYVQLGDLEKATNFRQELRGSAFQAYLDAKRYQAQQEWDLAISLFERHSRINGGWKAYNSLQVAQCYYEMGELDRAIAEARSAQKSSIIIYHSYYYPQSFLLLGKIYEKKRDVQLAIENTEKLLDLWKNADEDLPDLIEAKERLAKLRGLSRN